MRKVLVFSILAATTALAAPQPADAGYLSIVGGTPYVLPLNHNLVNDGLGGAGAGATFQGIAGVIGGQLVVDYTGSPSGLRGLIATYQGNDALFQDVNAGSSNVAPVTFTGFSNKSTPFGATTFGLAGPGSPVDFTFTIDRPFNGPGVDETVTGPDNRIFMALLSDGSVLVAFEDILPGGDNDYDDMAFTVAAVPVPAAVPLFLSGLAGLGLLGRRRTITIS